MSLLNDEIIDAHKDALDIAGEAYTVNGNALIALPGESNLEVAPDTNGYQRIADVVITILTSDIPNYSAATLAGKTATRTSDSRAYKIGQIIEDVPGLITLELRDQTAR
jgi:hypothetical protein